MAKKNLDKVQPIEIKLEKNLPMASSLQIAKHFDKQHNNVLQAIDSIKKDSVNNKDWFAINFQPTEESVVIPASGGIRKDPAYMLTRDGFTLLAMGFNGKKAIDWKIKYINAFNSMEKTLIEKIQKEKEVLGTHAKELEQINAELQNKLTRKRSNPARDSAYDYKATSIILYGLVHYWAYIDKIPAKVAHNAFLAAMECNSYDHLQITLTKGLNFIFRTVYQAIDDDEKVTQTQIDAINALLASCQEYYPKDKVNAFDEFCEVYDIFPFAINLLSQKSADKIIHALFTFHSLICR